MNKLSRTITGIVLILAGIIFLILSYITLVFIIYACALIIIGLFVFFNNKEDVIEQIKSNANSKTNKLKNETIKTNVLKNTTSLKRNNKLNNSKNKNLR